MSLPTISDSRRSLAVWMSSSSFSGLNWERDRAIFAQHDPSEDDREVESRLTDPVSHSFATSPSPRSISLCSCSVRMPPLRRALE